MKPLHLDAIDTKPLAGGLTLTQEEAVLTIMRLFWDEDIAAGITCRQRLHCDACAMPRPAPGFLNYDGLRFCNRCSFQFEVDQMNGLVDSPYGFECHLFAGSVESVTRLPAAGR